MCVRKNAIQEGDMRRSTYDRLEMVYQKFKGYIGTQELLKEGFSNRQIAVMAEEGHLEKVCHGYYWLAGKKEAKPSDYKCIEVCLSDPRAIVCMDSALYYQGMLKEEPEYCLLPRRGRIVACWVWLFRLHGIIFRRIIT